MLSQVLLLLYLMLAIGQGAPPHSKQEAKRIIIDLLAAKNGPQNKGVRWLIQWAGRYFFNTDDGVHGAELWTSDLSDAGTELFYDINPGPKDGYPNGFALYNERMYFAADDGEHGVELWRSDGSRAGTALVYDVNHGPASSYASTITACGDRLFFGAEDGPHGFEMRVTDGTAAGTTLLYDISPGEASSAISMVECRTSTAGAKLLFFTVGDADQWAQWVSDGTPKGTRPADAPAIPNDDKAEL